MARMAFFSLLLGGKSYEVKQEIVGTETNVIVGHERFTASVRDPRSFRSRSRLRGADEQGVMRNMKAPMPGKVVRVLAGCGDACGTGPKRPGN